MTRKALLQVLAGMTVAIGLASASDLHASVNPDSLAACSGDGTTLCLNNNRFSVRATFSTPQGQSGSGQAVSLTVDTGYFWFFSANNVELVIKVVDGRAVNNRFWVFAGGLTNVNVVITVTDTQTGSVRTYTNPQGVAFQPIQDTSAFAATAPEDSARFPAGALTTVTSDRAGQSLGLPQAEGAEAACVSDATTLCLNNGRFKVQAQWTTRAGQSGAGQAVALTGDTGYFWFFSSNNIEMVVKVLDACAFSRYWVFAGGLTDVNVVMTVTDTQTGVVKTYTNTQGTPFQPLQDTDAFATCAAAFAGNWTGQWVNTTFGSSGPASLAVSVNTSAQTFQATLTLGGNVFGSGTPPPQTFSGSYASSTFTQTSSVFGNLTVTVGSGGSITGSATNVPNPNISRMDFTGTATSQKITINYTVTFSASAGGGTALGVLTLNHVS